MYLVNDLQLTKNFKLSEFACKDFSKEIILDCTLVHKLQELRDKLGKPIYILSGYRTPDYNKRVGGVVNSQHILGKAADICVDGISITTLSTYAQAVGFDGIGIYSNFLHVDVRGYISRWNGK